MRRHMTTAKRVRRNGATTRRWNPLNMTTATLAAWYRGNNLSPQSAGNMTAWNDASANAYNLGTAVNTPQVVACGPSFCGEFTKASSEYVHATGLTITASSAGGLWAVFALRSGASTANFHTFIGIGNPSQTTRLIDLLLHPVSSALYPGMYYTNAGTSSYVRSNTPIADTNWHSVLLEGDTTGNTYRIWVDGTEITGGGLTTSGTQGNWLSDWTIYAPTRIGVGAAPRGGTPLEHADAKIYDAGFFHGTLGGDLTGLLSHLAARRAEAT